MSRRMHLSLVTAALALVGASAPVHAQSAYPVGDETQLVVQNNREVPVTVYLEAAPFERELGKVEAMRTATFDLPDGMQREGKVVEVLVQPRGQLALSAKAMMSDDGSVLGLVVPATHGQEKRMERVMVAWNMQNPVLVTQSTYIEEDIQD
jgi:hypothetical protein